MSAVICFDHVGCLPHLEAPITPSLLVISVLWNHPFSTLQSPEGVL